MGIFRHAAYRILRSLSTIILLTLAFSFMPMRNTVSMEIH